MFTKRSYILKQICSWKLQVCLSMYRLLLDTRKGLTFICLCDLYKIKFRCFCIGTVISCTWKVSNKHGMKIVRIRSFSGPLFPHLYWIPKDTKYFFLFGHFPRSFDVLIGLRRFAQNKTYSVGYQSKRNLKDKSKTSLMKDWFHHRWSRPNNFFTFSFNLNQICLSTFTAKGHATTGSNCIIMFNLWVLSILAKTHYRLMFLLYTPWKYRKISDFLLLSQSVEKEYWSRLTYITFGLLLFFSFMIMFEVMIIKRNL